MKVRFTRRAIGQIRQIARNRLAVFGEKVAREFDEQIDCPSRNSPSFPSLAGQDG